MSLATSSEGVTPGRRIKLICFPDQLCDTSQIDGLEGFEAHRHLESPQKVAHALRRLEGRLLVKRSPRIAPLAGVVSR